VTPSGSSGVGAGLVGRGNVFADIFKCLKSNKSHKNYDIFYIQQAEFETTLYRE
jgi:hypothetical protein